MNLTVKQILQLSLQKMNFALRLDDEGFINVENRFCAECNVLLRPELREDEPDGVCVRCLQPNCRRFYSIREGSFFEHAHLTIAQILVIMKQFQSLASISSTAELTGASAKSVGKYYKEIRELIAMDLEMNPIQYNLGGTYEVDETFYEHLKMENGVIVDQQWVAGFLHRETGKIKIYTVSDRRRATLVPPLLACIPPQALVFSDDHRSYHSLQQTYVHRSVNHSIGEYSRPENIPNIGVVQVNISRLENVWKKLKKLIANKQCRTYPHLRSYMNVLMFFSDGRNIFDLIKINEDA